MTQQMKQSYGTDESNQRMVADVRLMPWSYRLPIWGRFLIDLASGIIVGMIGTMAHRMGASVNIPYGLLIAYLMVIISTWSARSRDGVSGLALHLIGSSLAVWTVMAGYGPGGDAMIPVGFGGDDSMPFFSEQAHYRACEADRTTQKITCYFERCSVGAAWRATYTSPHG